jgi:hypothetical protein
MANSELAKTKTEEELLSNSANCFRPPEALATRSTTTDVLREKRENRKSAPTEATKRENT